MQRLIRTSKILGIVILVLIFGSGFWAVLQPPELLRVGSGYAAKIVCSNVFIAGRQADEVLASDVQAPGNPLLRLMRVTVDRPNHRVRAALLGFIATSDAVFRNGLGCAVTSDPAATASAYLPDMPASPPDPELPWPAGEKIESSEDVMHILSDATFTGSGMRAVVVVKDGRLVGEVYAPGFSKDVPLLGWSMTKTVNAAILGRLIQENRLSLDANDLLPQWSGDARREITLANLLAMESGLAFDEDYGTVADVTRMLYLEYDMAAFAASKPLEAKPGSRFSYSSGTAVLLARIWMNSFVQPEKAQVYPYRALFGPLGMRSAVVETDARGTFAASSYMYATARDWARFGLLLANGGVWQGERLLPEDFVQAMRTPNGHSGGRYSRMQTWLPARTNRLMPSGTFFMQGHDGQTIAINPSLGLVVVRLGLTPFWSQYDPSPLIAAVAAATSRGN